MKWEGYSCCETLRNRERCSRCSLNHSTCICEGSTHTIVHVQVCDIGKVGACVTYNMVVYIGSVCTRKEFCFIHVTATRDYRVNRGGVCSSACVHFLCMLQLHTQLFRSVGRQSLGQCLTAELL